MMMQSGATLRIACATAATSTAMPVTGEVCRIVATTVSGVISGA